jgi:murein DD-endopeptidase MepM/ murein hydrolase activator NlpD
MSGAATPAWTLIIVPSTTKAAPRRVGVRKRTVKLFAILVLLVSSVAWSWVDTQSSTARMLADRLAAQEQVVATLYDSLDNYRRIAIAERAAKSPPVDMMMPLAGRITSRFARSRVHPVLKIPRPHRGVDVSAPAGTQIVAPANATVASVGRRFGFGLMVELVHSGGVVTRYAHCRTALVRPGDQVAMGQPIATVGSSGLATAPHLHFEVLVGGKAVDPIRFLADTRSAPAVSPLQAFTDAVRTAED